MARKKTNVLNANVNMKGWHLLFFVVGFAVLGSVMLLQSFAAPGGSGKGKPAATQSSLTYTLVDDANSDGLANYNDKIRFTVGTTATTEPHVDVSCSQNGTVVYTAQTGYYEGYPWPWTQTFHLTSGAWTSGGAECTAKSYYFNGRKTVTLNTLNIVVHP